MAMLFVADDNSIMSATIALWRRGEITQSDFERCVAHWKRKDLVPLDWRPVENEN